MEQKERISLHTKLIVLKKLKEDVTLTHVAREVGISPQEVYNIFDEHIKIEKHKLPEVLCIDEFKNLKYAEGKYAVVLYDPINGIIIDVLESRLLSNLEDYFTRLDISDKKRVKYFISDMYDGYRTIKKKYLPNATHIVDSFHYIRYVYGAVNEIRINTMESFKANTKEYRILKKYWSLLNKPFKSVNNYEMYNPLIGAKSTTECIINSCLDLNNDLKKTYMLKEDFYQGFENIHYEKAAAFIDEFINKLNEAD